MRHIACKLFVQPTFAPCAMFLSQLPSHHGDPMNTTRTTAALAALTALHTGDQDGVNAALQAAGQKPRDLNDVGLLPLLGDLIAQDVNELDNIDPQLADQLSAQQVLLDEPNPEIPEIVQAIQQLLDVIEREHPSKAVASTAVDVDVPELDEEHIDPLDSEEDEPDLTPDPPEEDEQVEDEESEEVLENETEMDAPVGPTSEDVEIEADSSIVNEPADPETEEEPESEEDDGDDEVEVDGGDAVLALAGALTSNLVSRADVRDYIDSIADAVLDDDTAATLRRVHEALGDSDYTDNDVIKKLRTAASQHRDRLDEICIDLPESIANAKLVAAPTPKTEAAAAPKLVADSPVESPDHEPEDDDADKDNKSKSVPIRIAGERKVLEATVVITDDESEVYEPELEHDDDEDDLEIEDQQDEREGEPPEQPPLLELDDEDDDSDEDEWMGTPWAEPEAEVSTPEPTVTPAPRPTGKPVIQLATTRVPKSEASAEDLAPEPEEPEVVEQSELSPEPAPRKVPPPLQAAAPNRGPALKPKNPPATPRGDMAEDTLEGLSPGQTPDPAPETQTTNDSSNAVEVSKGVSMRTLELTAALATVVALVAIGVTVGGLAVTGAGVGVYQWMSGSEQVAANPAPAPVVRPSPAPVAPRPQPTRQASVWDSAMQSGGNLYVSTGSAEWVLYETRKVNGDVRYSGGSVNESCLNGSPGVHDATASCPRRERLF